MEDDSVIDLIERFTKRTREIRDERKRLNGELGTVIGLQGLLHKTAYQFPDGAHADINSYIDGRISDIRSDLHDLEEELEQLEHDYESLAEQFHEEQADEKDDFDESSDDFLEELAAAKSDQ